MLLVLLTAEDCGVSYNEPAPAEKRTDLFQDIETNFTNDNLPDENLKAFEKRAEEKLIDLNDYLNIYADPSSSKEFRIQARKMIRQLFISEGDINLLYKSLEIIEDSVDVILINKTDRNFFQTEVKSITIEKKFNKVSDSEYIGETLLRQQINIKKSDSENEINTPIRMKAIKTFSEFGDETLEVWKVFFEL